jgi:hypothetical protein
MSPKVALAPCTIGSKSSVKNPFVADSYAYWLSRHADKHMTFALAPEPLGTGGLAKVLTVVRGLDATRATRATSAATTVITVDLARTPATPMMGAA